MTPAAIRGVEAAIRFRGRIIGLGRYPDPWRYFDGAGIDEVVARCEEAGRDLLAFLRPPGDLVANGVRESLCGGRGLGETVQLVAFDSPAPSGRPNNDRVVLRLHRPPRGAQDRVVVFHHPVFQSRWAAWDWFLAPLAREIPVAMLAGPYHFSRTPPREFAGEGLVNPNPWRLFEGMRQWSWDQRAAMNLLDGMGMRPVAVVGFSLGAFQSLLVAAGGDLLVPIVAIASTNRYDHGVRYGVLTGGLRDALEAIRFDPGRFARAVEAIQLERYVPRLRGRPVLFVAGRYDRVDPPPSIDRLEAALAPERVVRLEAGHATVLLRRGQVTAEMISFFRSHGIIGS